MENTNNVATYVDICLTNSACNFCKPSTVCCIEYFSLATVLTFSLVSVIFIYLC